MIEFSVLRINIMIMDVFSVVFVVLVVDDDLVSSQIWRLSTVSASQYFRSCFRSI